MIELLLVLVIFLSEVSIYGIKIVDVFLILAILYYFAKEHEQLDSKKILLFSFLLMLGLIPFILNFTKGYFDKLGFWLSYAKQAVYLISLLFLVEVGTEKEEKINKIIKNSIYIIIIFSLIKSFTYFFIPSLRGAILSVFPKSVSYGTYRETGIYSEPAHLVFLSIFYFYLLFTNVKMEKVFHVLIVIVLILSNSITAVGFHMASLAFYFMTKVQFNIYYILIIPLVLIFLGIVAYQIPLFKHHINNLIHLNRSSAVTRIFGGFELMIKGPFFGAGFGNIENYVLANKDIIGLKFLTTSSGTITNNFSALYSYYGWIGLVVLLVWYYKLFKNISVMYFFVFLLSFFTNGMFNDFSFYIIILLVLTQKRKQEIIAYQQSLSEEENLEETVEGRQNITNIEGFISND